MPSNERWRRFKIVEVPVNSNPVEIPNRSNEIIGGLKNALERGEPLEKAKQSFINAGYKVEEVDSALIQVPQVSSKISKDLPQDISITPVKKGLFGKLKTSPKPILSSAPTSSSPTLNGPSAVKSSSESRDKASKGLIIALIIMGVLVLGGAVYLGLNWNSFF